MVNLAIRFIRRASKRPLLSLAWTLLTAAAVYVAHYYVDNPDFLAKLEEESVTIRNLEKERIKAEEIYFSWEHLVWGDSSLSVVLMNYSVDSFNAMKGLPFINFMEKKKADLGQLSVKVNTSHFRSEAYESMRGAISGDLQFLDDYNSRSLAFTKAVFFDFEKAKTLKPQMEDFSSPRRKLDEMHVRFGTLDEILEVALEEHNVMVRSYNARMKVYQTKLWANIIAQTYIMTFIGCCLGILVNRKKRKWLRPYVVAARRKEPQKAKEQHGKSNTDILNPHPPPEAGNE